MIEPEAVQRTIARNAATSFGLTLVAGLPFPADLQARLGAVCRQIESLAPNRFRWYRPEHLHATLVAPRRGIYRPAPPLTRDDLPPDLAGFVRDLTATLAGMRPFSLALAGVHLTPNGLLAAREKTAIQPLVALLGRHPALDAPKTNTGLHITLGYLKQSPAEGKIEEDAPFIAALRRLREEDLGAVVVERIWLVHYANRTLNRIVGKIPFRLGEARGISVEAFVERLGIERGSGSAGEQGCGGAGEQGREFSTLNV